MKTFLAINPGSTSTKIALYRGNDSWTLEEIAHAELTIGQDDAARMPEPIDQVEFRSSQIDEFLREAGAPQLHAVVGRGGITRPLEAGSYAVNQAMIDDLTTNRYGTHASNLGALLAASVARIHEVPALIVDPVGVDQFEPLARYSGWPALARKSQLHALNMRSVAREACRQLGGSIEDYNVIIAHLGGGISIGPMKKGRLIDVNNAMDGGPFSPQRTGTLPLRGLVELAYSGQFPSAKALVDALTRKGGLLAYLGTDDAREIIARISAGDAKAEEIYQAMAYQIAKEIGAMATVLGGAVDAIVLTGGLARPPLTDWIAERCDWIAPLILIPGERELLSLAQAGARHVCEGEALQAY
ncbi:MAG: butyrate kinase [Spirochaetales bacterium]|nr:butyrate kinase [Spirochaetales bacterium]